MSNARAHLVGAATYAEWAGYWRASGRMPARQGGARFARSLVKTGLIDEYRLVVHPVVLGAGERLFSTPHTVESTSTTAFSAGAVAHVFAARLCDLNFAALPSGSAVGNPPRETDSAGG